MKKIVSVFICISLVMSIFSFSVFADDSLKGDMDGNGVLSLYDAMLIQEKENKLFEKYDVNADINNDGRISAADTSIVQKAVLNNDYQGYENSLAKAVWFSSISTDETIPEETLSKFKITERVSNAYPEFPVHTYSVKADDVENLRNIVMLFTFADNSVDFEQAITFDSTLSTPRFYLWKDGQLLIGLTFRDSQNFDGVFLKFNLKSNADMEYKSPAFEILEYNSLLNGKSCFHMGGTADCISNKTCDYCGEHYGSLGSHVGGKATCSNQAVCETCGENYGELISHIGGTASCSEKAVCDVCGQSYGAKLPHQNFDFSEDCDVCGEGFSADNSGINTSVLIFNDYLLYTIYFTDVESFHDVSFELEYDIDVFFDSECDYFGDFIKADVNCIPGTPYVYKCDFTTADGFKIDKEMPILISFALYFREVNTFSYDDIPEMFEFSVSDAVMTGTESECIFNDAVAVDCRHEHVDNNSDYFCDLCSVLISDNNCGHIDENYDCKCDACGSPVFYYGDMNCDGNITAADARIALRISAKLQTATLYDWFVGDLDGDGKITAAEARKILRVAALIDSF